jgi:tellurite resistance protein TehA-like permease
MSGAALGTLIAAAACLVGQAVLVARSFGSLGDPSRLVRLLVAGAAAFGVASLASSRVDVVPICLAATAAYIMLVIALRVVPRRLRRRH